MCGASTRQEGARVHAPGGPTTPWRTTVKPSTAAAATTEGPCSAEPGPGDKAHTPRTPAIQGNTGATETANGTWRVPLGAPGHPGRWSVLGLGWVVVHGDPLHYFLNEQVNTMERRDEKTTTTQPRPFVNQPRDSVEKQGEKIEQVRETQPPGFSLECGGRGMGVCAGTFCACSLAAGGSLIRSSTQRQ